MRTGMVALATTAAAGLLLLTLADRGGSVEDDGGAGSRAAAGELEQEGAPMRERRKVSTPARKPEWEGDPGQGRVNFIRNATSPFDRHLTASTSAERRWMAAAYWRIRGYDPFFADSGALDWAPPAHVYEDLYAIYRDVPADQQLLADHPDWVLRDPAGRALFIPYDCNGQTCTQYAADFGNPAFRGWWISRLLSVLARGYRGVFIDDVNMEMRVSDGFGRDVRPLDPRTGRSMRNADWRRYLAEFTEQIRTALPPAIEIVHNAHWWIDRDDPFVQRQLAAADLIELERGYTDPGLGEGAGRFGFRTLMAHVDWLHSLGKSVILEPHGLDPARQEFELAGYFLTRAGEDAIASDYRSDPGDFSPAWLTDLGAPRGRRELGAGIWRRHFDGGLVLLNEPGGRPRTVRMDPPHLDLAGREVSQLTLAGGRGAVLRRIQPASAP
ncbi:MAG: putative glycoside hydrolase [Solirubrobacterales bacterium]